MQMPKPTEADKERFRSVVPDDARVEVKPMFGNLGAFVNGNMFMGLFGSSLGVKLAPGDAERLRAAGGGPFGPEERPMSGWVSLPPAAIGTADGARWIAAALDHVAAMPPKAAEGLAGRAGQPVISARSLNAAATTSDADQPDRRPGSTPYPRTGPRDRAARRTRRGRRRPPRSFARWNGMNFTTSGRKIPANVSPK